VIDLFERKEFVVHVDARPARDEILADIVRQLGLPATA
jgi:hypothetical protein